MTWWHAAGLVLMIVGGWFLAALACASVWACLGERLRR